LRLHFLSELTLNTFIMDKKRVYTFGNGQAEGKADMRNLLGGKGANLAEMNLIGVPVPPGFTITTEVCSEYYELGKDKVVELLKADVEKAIANIENLMNSKFGDVENPLLVSVRSGARASMPGRALHKAQILPGHSLSPKLFLRQLHLLWLSSLIMEVLSSF
jgi:pyruvate, orthophosphate dikinase